MKEYFNFKFFIKNNIPKLEITIKQEYKKGNAMGDNGMPLSPSSLRYFVFHFGDSIGSSIYDYYKQFFNKKNSLLFCLKELFLTEEQKEFIEKYLENINSKMLKNHKSAISKPEYRKKLSESYNRELHSKIKKERYKNPIFKAEMYEKMHNPNTQLKRVNSYKKWLDNGGREILKEACNRPERKAKISEHSKKMWKKWKKTYFLSSYPKNYKIDGISMNSIEFKIASYLKELNVSWNYENSSDEHIFLPDFCIQNTKKVIECYGDFWHANPNLFKDQEKILIGTTRVKDVWNKDKDRQKILEDLGYKVLVLWEQDINNNLEQVKEQIRNFLNE